MKILLLGKNGQLGWELQRTLSSLGDVFAFGHEELDLTRFYLLKQAIRKLRPELIINAAGFTNVDKAEQEKELAMQINAEALWVLGGEAAKMDAKLIHFSTDHVFDGRGTQPWKETCVAMPINHYGISKLAGEEAVIASQCRYLIFRTSWVYSARGKNFLKTILRLAAEDKTLRVVDDQIGAPTSAELVARVVAECIPHLNEQSELNGIFHLTALGETSKYDFAKYILEHTVHHHIKEPPSILRIKTKDYPLPAKRPYNSRLNTDKLLQTFSLELPLWQEGVISTLKCLSLNTGELN